MKRSSQKGVIGIMLVDIGIVLIVNSVMDLLEKR
jgi:hypothetical protein